MHFMHWFVDLIEKNSIIFNIFFVMINLRLILSISLCDQTIILTNEWIFLSIFWFDQSLKLSYQFYVLIEYFNFILKQISCQSNFRKWSFRFHVLKFFVMFHWCVWLKIKDFFLMRFNFKLINLRCLFRSL